MLIENELKINAELPGNGVKTYEIETEIFTTGKWNGDEYTTADFQEMVKNFYDLRGQVKPYMALGHDKSQKLLQNDGYPAAGWITELRENGKALIAKIQQIPEKIYTLIQNKAYGRFSPEIIWGYRDGDKRKGKVLSAVALLGANMPACKTIDDFINLYGDQMIKVEYSNNELDIHSYENLKSEDTKMENELKELTEKFQNAQNKYTELEKKYSEMIAKEKEYSEKLEKYEAEKKELKKKEYDNYFTLQVKNGIINPSQKNYYSAIAMSDVDFEKSGLYEYSENGENKKLEYKNLFELVKNVIENNVKLDMEQKTEKVEEKQVEYSDELERQDNEIENIINDYKKSNPSIGYSEAFEYANKIISEKKYADRNK